MKKILLFSLLIIGFSLNAQIPGFMGKKFSVIYSSSFSPPHLSNLYNRNLRPNFGHQHTLAFEYVIKKHTSFGLRYKIGLNRALNAPNGNNERTRR